MKTLQTKTIIAIGVSVLAAASVTAGDFDDRIVQFASSLTIPTNTIHSVGSNTQINNAVVQLNGYTFDVTNLSERIQFLLPMANKAVSVSYNSETLATGIVYTDDNTVTASAKLLEKTVENTLPIELLCEKWRVMYSFNSRKVIVSHKFDKVTSQWLPDHSNVSIIGSGFGISLNFKQSQQNTNTVATILSNLVIAVESICSP